MVAGDFFIAFETAIAGEPRSHRIAMIVRPTSILWERGLPAMGATRY
jgi:hypothetical protein